MTVEVSGPSGATVPLAAAPSGGDDTAALQALINALPASGGTIYLHAGTYVVTSALNLDGKIGVVLQGWGGLNNTLPSTPGLPSATTIKTTANAASLLTAKGSNGLVLRDLALVYSSATYTAKLLDFTGTAALPTLYPTIERCYIGMLAGAKRDSGNALLYLLGAVFVNVKDTIIYGGRYNVQGRLSSVGGVDDFSNVVGFRGCTFGGYHNASYAIINIGQAWSFHQCTFEPGNTVNQALAQDHGTPGKGASFVDCWFGDNNTADPFITWNGKGLSIRGGYATLASGRILVKVNDDVTDATDGIEIGGGICLDAMDASSRLIDFGTTVNTKGVVIGACSGKPTTYFTGTPGQGVEVVGGQSTTANRQTATSMGPGASWYDTTLGKKIWSDGSIWHVVVEGGQAGYGGAYKSGWYAVPRCLSVGNTATTQNEMIGAVMPIPKACSVDRISVEVTVLALLSTVRLGIHNVDPITGLPTSLVLDAGTVDSTTTGVKEITINQALSAGLVATSGTSQGGAPSVRTSLGLLPMFASAANAISTPNNYGGWAVLGVSGALPDPFGTPAGYDPAHRVALRYV